MSPDQKLSPRDRQICALLCTTEFNIVTIQTIPFHVRVSHNKLSWMQQQGLVWLTLPELQDRLGHLLDNRVAAYSPEYSFDDWLTRDALNINKLIWR